MIHESVLGAIGGTPLVRLGRIHRPGNLVAKVEHTNPGGSIKERIAVTMIDAAEREGMLKPGGTIVEPTSGNTGVGLAMVAAVRGYHAIFTVPDKVAREKIDLLRAYGAEVHVCPTDVVPENPLSYYSTAQRLLADVEGAFSPDQYSNPANPQAHYESTGPEIWEQTHGAIDVLVVGAGTGGTISGAGQFLKEKKHDLMVVGADPEGSIYTAPSHDEMHQYLVEGVGEDLWPSTLDRTVVDRWMTVTDADSFKMAHRLAQEEGLVVGGSCGMAAWAALQVAQNDPEKLVVVILPDNGRGYVSKVFNDEWLAEHGLDVQ